jgi:hypothetical protein
MKRPNVSVLPPSPLRLKTTVTPRVWFNAARLKGVRYGYGWRSVGPSVVGWVHIGVSVAFVGLIGVSFACVVLGRSVRGYHNVVLEVSDTLNDLYRVFS